MGDKGKLCIIKWSGRNLLMEYVDINEAKRKGVYFLDSRCSNHMKWNKDGFDILNNEFNHSVKVGNSHRMMMKGKGRIKLEVEWANQIVGNIYYVPNLENNISSIGQIQEKGIQILICLRICRIYHPTRGCILETRMTSNKMLMVSTKVSKQSTCFCDQYEEMREICNKRL